MRWLLTVFILLWPAQAAAQPRIVTDLSQRSVEIAYSFDGVEILLFGAIQGLPAGTRPDIAVVLRGPDEPVTVRFKERVAGVWMNTQAVRFQTAPSYYAIASTRPIADMASERWRAVHELGVQSLHFSPATGGDQSAAMLSQFRDGFVDLRTRLGLFAQGEGSVELMDAALFRSRFVLPARVPVGTYAADVYLFANREVVAQASVPLTVSKTGFERRVYETAQSSPVLYGLTAVLIALAAGWLAGVAFRR
jgi:uncharacterized protein (TIGR02186 family)